MKQPITAPDWLPDPRDQSRYPNPENAPLAQWAWEFLRRNPNYQKEYADLVKYAKQQGMELTSVLNLPRREWLIRPFTEQTTLKLAEDYWKMADKFGVRLLEDPSSEYGPDHYRLFQADAVRTWCLHRRPIIIEPLHVNDPKNSEDSKQEKRTLVVELDPSRPWNLQVESVRKTFEDAQKMWGQIGGPEEVYEERNVNPRLWLDYLRILDAEERGESHTSIARWLFPVERRNSLKSPGKSISRMLRQAKEWRDFKYKEICAPRRRG